MRKAPSLYTHTHTHTHYAHRVTNIWLLYVLTFHQSYKLILKNTRSCLRTTLINPKTVLLANVGKKKKKKYFP